MAKEGGNASPHRFVAEGTCPCADGGTSLRLPLYIVWVGTNRRALDMATPFSARSVENAMDRLAHVRRN